MKGAGRCVRIINKALFAIAAIIPFGLASVLATSVFFRCSNTDSVVFYLWKETAPEINFIFLVIVLLLFAGITLLYKVNSNLLMWIAVLGCIFRIALAWMFCDLALPFSDYSEVWQISNNASLDENTCSKYLFSHWMNWILFQSFLVRIMSLSYSQIIMLEALFGCLITFEIFLLTSRITSKTSLGLLASALYAIMPSQILFELVPKPDTFAVAFILGGAILLSYQLKDDGHSSIKVIAISLLAGTIIGIGDSVKPVGMILVIAYGIVLILATMKNQKKKVWLNLLSLLLVTIFTIAIPKYITTVAEKYYDIEIDKSSTMSSLCIGLNTEGEGQIHLGTKSRSYIQMRLNGLSQEDASKDTAQMLKDDWTQNSSSISYLFWKKMVWAWQDDVMPAKYFEICLRFTPLEYSTDMTGGIYDHPLKANIANFVSLISFGSSQSYYLFTMLTAMMGALYCLRNVKLRNDSMTMICLFILGFTLLLLIAEAQSRYKSNIMSYICVFSAIGVSQISAFIHFATSRVKQAHKQTVTFKKRSNVLEVNPFRFNNDRSGHCSRSDTCNIFAYYPRKEQLDP